MAQLAENSNFKDPENEDKHPWAYSPGKQQVILNCHKYFQKALKDQSRAVKTTANALKVSRNTVYCVVRCGTVQQPNRIKNQERLSKVNSFTKDLIRATIYEFYDQKICPTLDMMFEKIQEKTKGEGYEFPYGRTWFSKLIKSLGFCYCRSNNREVLMESPHIMAWQWEFLRKIRKLRAEGYTPVYVDETWFDSHETMSHLLSDGSKSCSLHGPVSRRKRIVIAHAGTSNGFIPGSLLLCGKNCRMCLPIIIRM